MDLRLFFLSQAQASARGGGTAAECSNYCGDCVLDYRQEQAPIASASLTHNNLPGTTCPHRSVSSRFQSDTLLLQHPLESTNLVRLDEMQ